MFSCSMHADSLSLIVYLSSMPTSLLCYCVIDINGTYQVPSGNRNEQSSVNYTCSTFGIRSVRNKAFKLVLTHTYALTLGFVANIKNVHFNSPDGDIARRKISTLIPFGRRRHETVKPTDSVSCILYHDEDNCA
jgi:uncharacterized protein YijF (DUF1287 family)